MTENPLYGKFDDMVRASLRPSPKPAPPEGTPPRVAVLFDGYDDSPVGRATEAGLNVVYTRKLGDDREPLNFRYIPVFDVLTAALPEDSAKRKRAFGYVLRFLRIRRPGLFFLEGLSLVADAEFVAHAQNSTERLGYRIEGDPARTNLLVGTA